MPDPALPPNQDRVRPAEAAEIAQARGLMQTARFAALAYSDPDTTNPGISRIAFGLDPDAGAITLISALSQHFAALCVQPACALLVGEPGPKGDPLTHPRLMLQACAHFVAADDPTRGALRARWLRDHPKSALYVDFADFAFVRLSISRGLLNGGFGRAFNIPPEALRS